MPVIDSIIMSIFPDDGEGIGSHGNNVADPSGWRISQLDSEYICIGFRLHVLMSAAARGARTCRAQQLKWIDARMIIAPCDCEFFGLFIGSNACWFFVHFQTFSPLLKGEGSWGEVKVLEHNLKSPLRPSQRAYHHTVRQDTTTHIHPLRADHLGR